MKYRLSDHARKELARRSIPLAQLEAVLNNPQQVISQKAGRAIYQSQIDMGDGKIVLLRVIVAEDQEVVVTAYRTRNIQKYWRES